MKKIELFTLILGLVSLSATPYRGVVFEDKNKNGLQDRFEKGVPNLAISNGDTVVMTDRKGTFVIPLLEGESVFPILPSHYRTGTSKVGNENLFIKPTQEKPLSIPLYRQEVRYDFSIGAVGDIQVDDLEELSYATSSLFTELSNREDLSFYLQLGDLVNDQDTLLRPMYDLLKTLPSPSYVLPGNHDRGDRRAEKNSRRYKELFGGDLAFYYGNALFILFNDIQTLSPKGESEIMLNERQIRFLNNILAITPKQTTLVIGAHAPFFSMTNKDELLSRVAPFRQVLLLSAHLHQVTKREYAENICELVVGAPCGMFWLGQYSYDAVPLSLQHCGTPRNYFVVDFTASGYTLHYKGIGLDRNIQMDLWAQGENQLDKSGPLASYPARTLVANVYAGGETTKVRMRVNGGGWVEMKRSKGAVPSYSRLFDWTKNNNYPMLKNKRQPLRSTQSPLHLWEGQLPESAHGSCVIEVEAKDSFGLDIRQKKILYIE